MDSQLRAICATHGVFLRKEALALGYHDRIIKARVGCGIWHRVRRGAYTFGDTWQAADRAQRYRLFVLAAIRQSKTHVVASHASAVAFHEAPLWGLDLSVAHLTRRDEKTGRKEAGVQQHRGILEPDDVVRLGSIEVMSATRTALEVTTIAETEPSVCVVNDLLHRKLTTIQDMKARYASMEVWPSTLHTDLVLRLADGRYESIGETRTFFVVKGEGLPLPVPQFEVYDENGLFIGRVDMAWPEHGVFLEFDGREKYLRFRRKGQSVQDAVLEEKRREDLICSITGWRCIRVTWADLERPGVLGYRIRQLLFPRG